MTTLAFERAVYDRIVAHAREGAPREVCGVLGGHREGPTATVTVARRVANVADHPESRYELDPAEQVWVMDEMEESGREVVGFYHSHPRGPDRPSGVDEARATWEGHSYCIVSLAGEEREGRTGAPTVGSWRWTGEGFEQEAVEVRGQSA